jgi:hypothetical protein
MKNIFKVGFISYQYYQKIMQFSTTTLMTAYCILYEYIAIRGTRIQTARVDIRREMYMCVCKFMQACFS